MLLSIILSTTTLLVCTLAAPLDDLPSPTRTLHAREERSCSSNVPVPHICGASAKNQCLKVDNFELSCTSPSKCRYDFTIKPLNGDAIAKCTFTYESDGPSEVKAMDQGAPCQPLRDDRGGDDYSVRAFSQTSPDVIFVNVEGPGGATITFLAKMRQVPCTQTLEVIQHWPSVSTSSLEKQPECVQPAGCIPSAPGCWVVRNLLRTSQRWCGHAFNQHGDSRELPCRDMFNFTFSLYNSDNRPVATCRIVDDYFADPREPQWKQVPVDCTKPGTDASGQDFKVTAEPTINIYPRGASSKLKIEIKSVDGSIGTGFIIDEWEREHHKFEVNQLCDRLVRDLNPPLAPGLGYGRA